MVMPMRTSLVVPCLISVPISDLTASGNSNLTIFSSFVTTVRFYTSSVYRVIYIALDF